MRCIKCNKEIPDGELFCVECSLNPPAPVFEEHGAVRRPAPKGRMQTPQQVARPAVQPAPAQKSGSRKGLITALVLVSLALAAVVGLVVWKYSDFVVARNQLYSQKSDLLDQSMDLVNLEILVNQLQVELDEANTVIAAKELEIQELASRLSGSQSDTSQASYDLSTKTAELETLMEENRQLAAIIDDLEGQLNELLQEVEDRDTALTAAVAYKEKADFMDSYVVFVENDGSGVYHTYDCEKFSHKNFWAYSRKLAESNGYKPCPECGGKTN